MAIIYLFGPDGSGKTTLAKRLVRDLSRNGQKVRYSWMRGSHTAASIAARLFAKLDSYKGKDNPYYGITVPERLTRFWQALECLSVAPVILLRFVLPHRLGFTVVADRYTIDFIVWVGTTTVDAGFVQGFIAKCAAYLARECELLMFVTADPETLVKRSGMDIDFLRRQNQMYLSFVKRHSLNVYTIETSEKSVDHSYAKVMELVGERSK
ncbi:MAG: thymidylate kinase [Thermoplasmata archaeon]|nr:thymidylate kinase [Thermoplasmata archaeon]